jgi:hypothetical protein
MGTDMIEDHFSILKRDINGVYHYIGEFCILSAAILVSDRSHDMSEIYERFPLALRSHGKRLMISGHQCV